jgi:hypothetical protein
MWVFHIGSSTVMKHRQAHGTGTVSADCMLNSRTDDVREHDTKSPEDRQDVGR